MIGVPESTDGDVWQSAETLNAPLRERTRKCLRENRGKAIRVRELSDEILGTEWDSEIGEAEYEEKDSATPRHRLQYEMHMTTRLRVYLDELMDEGMVEMRTVASALTDSPIEEGEEVLVTYVGK